MSPQHLGQLRVVHQLTGPHEFQTFHCSIKDRHAVAARETRFVTDTVYVRVLIIECAAKSATGSLIACTRGDVPKQVIAVSRLP